MKKKIVVQKIPKKRPKLSLADKKHLQRIMGTVRMMKRWDNAHGR